MDLKTLKRETAASQSGLLFLTQGTLFNYFRKTKENIHYEESGKFIRKSF